MNCALQERLELLMEQAARLEAEATERKLRAAEAPIWQSKNHGKIRKDDFLKNKNIWKHIKAMAGSWIRWKKCIINGLWRLSEENSRSKKDCYTNLDSTPVWRLSLQYARAQCRGRISWIGKWLAEAEWRGYTVIWYHVLCCLGLVYFQWNMNMQIWQCAA